MKKPDLNISVNDADEIIIKCSDVSLNFGVISTGGYGGIEIKKDVFNPINIFYTNIVDADILTHIFEQYQKIHELLSGGIEHKEVINMTLGNMVGNLITLHHYSTTHVNIFNSRQASLLGVIYDSELNTSKISLNDYFALAELSIVLKLLVPIHSMCDIIFEEEEDFALTEKILFDSIEYSLFGINNCSSNLSSITQDYGYDGADLIETLVINIYLAVLPFVDIYVTENTLLKEIYVYLDTE